MIVRLLGNDDSALRSEADEVRTLLSNVPGLVDLRIEPLLVETQNWNLHLRREELTRYELTPQDVAEVLETALSGRRVGSVLNGGARHDLIVRFGDEFSREPVLVSKILLETPAQGGIPLGAVAELVAAARPAEIFRENGVRCVVVAGNLEGRDKAEVRERVDLLLRRRDAALRTKQSEVRLEW